MEKIKNYNNFSYLIGLLQTDGNLYETTRNRGRISLEIGIKDQDIIKKITKIIPVNYSIKERTRQTNKGYIHLISLRIHDLSFRNLVKKWGVPAGKKSLIIKPPLHISQLSIKDYIRGLFDGDGSLGYTKIGFPYIGFVTQSDEIKNFILDYVSKMVNKPKKQNNRNKRDNIYNLYFSKEDAVKFCEEIYPNRCLSLNRKYEKAQEIKKWIRPSTMRINPKQTKWDKTQDDYILSHSINESIKHLNRTKSSVIMRLWRLNKSM